MAVGASVCLLILIYTTRLFRTFDFGLLDFCFILLPAGVLTVKILLKLLAGGGLSEADETADSMQFLAAFFRPLWKIARDWFPFFLLCACYYALFNNLTLRINPHTADPFLAKIDAALFGNQVSFLLEPFIRPWLTDFLNAIYFSHLIFFPGVALYFYLKKNEIAFRRLMMGYLTLFLMGIVSFILVPAVGPFTYFSTQYDHDLNGHLILHTFDNIFRTGHVPCDCFPSLHVAIPFLISLYLRDYARKAFIPTLVYVGLMSFTTVYLRYHYAIDVIAAFAYAPAAYWLNDFLLRQWPGEKKSGMAGQIEQKNQAASS